MSNEYPAFFFHVHEGRKKVLSQKERDALGPEWSDSPATVNEAFAVAHALPVAASGEAEPVPPPSVIVPPADIPVIVIPPGVSVPSGDVPAMETPPVDQATLDDQEKQALWSAPVGVIVESLEGAPRDVLEHVKAFEEQNPKTPRVTVLRAIEKALAVTQAPQPDVVVESPSQ